MTMDTITINLDPTDVVITTTMDPVYGPQYTLTIEKAKAAFFAKFMLEGLTPSDQTKIPLDIKENIVQSTGLKYVFRLPSITRSLLIGTAAGIALKTLSDSTLPKQILEEAPKLVLQGINAVQLHPYISAAILTAAATLSNLVSQQTAQFVSDFLEGTKTCVIKTATLALNGLVARDHFINYHPAAASALAGTCLIAATFYAPAFQTVTEQVKELEN